MECRRARKEPISLRAYAALLLITNYPVEGREGASRDPFPASTLSSGINWPSGGGDYSERRFSLLSEINSTTVRKLGLVWSLDLPHEHSLEATPLAVDGVLYFTGQNCVVYAVDGVSGLLLWKYDPQVWKPDASQLRFIFSVNRGVAYWKGKLFVGTIDGRLIALDAKSGAVVWSTQTLPHHSKRTI